MFRFFETLIDPYQPYDETAEIPNRLIPFCRRFLYPARWVLLASMVLGLIFAISEALLLRFAGQLVDILTEAQPDRLWQDHGDTLLVMIAVVILVRPLSVIVESFVSGQGYYAPMGALVRWRTHRKMLRQSLSFFSDDFAGRVANKQLQLAPSLNDATHQLAQEMWYAGVYLLGAAVILAETDLRLVAPLALWFAGTVAVAVWFVPRITRAGKAVAEARSDLAGRIVDSYTNIQTVKLFAHAEREEEYAREAMEAFRWVFHAQTRLYTWLNIWLSALSILLIGGVVGYGVWLWSLGAISVGPIAAASALVMRLSGMVEWIMWSLSMLFQNIGTVQEGMEMVSKPLGLKDRPGAPALKLERGEIRFDHVTHQYGRDRRETGGAGGVADVSLTIRGGERVGLVGRSGAGKSTLVNLALRFFDPDDGRVLIDGQDLADCQQDSVRRQISMVTQDTALLHRSIRDNIAYGRPEATEAELWEAAAKVHADEFIPGLVDREGRRGLDAHVGERGVRLSGGQRQRIALARAVLKNAPILILDEATSALDSEVEAAIQEAMADLMAGKTVVAIAHRLSTIQSMDRIVVLDRGRIIEEGSHEALLETGGLYARLWKRQSGGFLAADLEAEPAAE
ncbi:ABC transporter ATP-binding protein [Paralimibaculum aggregatum]|uniref:ABC transporter ATP-binding protein n=1 Tax=Paralimibaculum aggregatum TaxID=3036245 RepID=A0ABQ6LRX2_9RHOB|nr:ABC transporter ATP-binding protein [Limibaculum sp. NKW23]GMG84261.1 ABC transporter ATP-binding protein [Limibaculum sp. NKW23]